MRALREALDQTFSKDELRTLCVDLGIDYEDIPGDGKDSLVRELVAYVERRGRLPELIAYVQRARPHLNLMLPESRPEPLVLAPPPAKPPSAIPRWSLVGGALVAALLLGLLAAGMIPPTGQAPVTPPATTSLDLTSDSLTVRELEPLLREANILLSAAGTQQEQAMRSYFTGPDSAYHLLAVNSLQVLDGQRFRQPIYLDELDRWYTERVGETDYVAEGRRLHAADLQAAMVQAWNNHYGQQQTALAALLEPAQ
jgi:hypothetical protein